MVNTLTNFFVRSAAQMVIDIRYLKQIQNLKILFYLKKENRARIAHAVVILILNLRLYAHTAPKLLHRETA